MATLGGVTLPPSSASPTPPSSTSLGDVPLPNAPAVTPGTAPSSTGGLNFDSSYYLPPTSTAEQLTAIDGTQDVQTADITPTSGVAPAPVKEVIKAVMADWYRYGKPSEAPESTGEMERTPKQISPWEFDEKTASIRVYGYGAPKDGVVGDKQMDLIPPYTKFILESVSEVRDERSQIVETFGDFYVFFFGERPPVYQFSGTLINTRDVNWLSDFKFYYENFLRGSKCVENNARLILTYAGRQIEGFMPRMQSSTEASVEAGVKVSFPMIVTRQTFLGFSDDFGFLTQGDQTIKNTDLIELIKKIAGEEGKGTSDPQTSSASQATSSAMIGGEAVKALIGK